MHFAIHRLPILKLPSNGFATLFQTGLLLVIRDVDPFHENKKHILFITRSFKITSTAVTFKMSYIFSRSMINLSPQTSWEKNHAIKPRYISLKMLFCASVFPRKNGHARYI